MLSLPAPVVESARVLAEQAGCSVEAVLNEWVQAGMVQRLSAALLAEGTIVPNEESLSQEEAHELATLFHWHRTVGLTDEEGARLDSLVHRYRQYRVEEARAVTDWLALGGVQGLGSPVSQLVTLRSNMLYAAGYDAEKQVLDVVFNSGGVYRYFDVPPHIYQGLIKAPSAGRYMWEHVFSVYPNVRLDRKRGTRRTFSRERRQLSQAAERTAAA